MKFIINLLNRSLIARSGFAMGAIAFITLVTVFSSAYITNQVEGHAAAINLAGSLRMQSYRLAMDLVDSRFTNPNERLDTLKDDSQKQLQRLLNPVLLKVIPDQPQHQVNKTHKRLLNAWKTQIVPRLDAGALSKEQVGSLVSHLQLFIEVADLLVTQIQLDEEDRIRQMQIIQWISIILILLVIIIAMFDLTRNVIAPLRQLVGAARAASAAKQGDFSIRITPKNPDELGALADTFNAMSETLSEMYSGLACRVEEKTQELQISNTVLQLLYSSATCLAEGRGSEKSIRKVLDNLRDTINFQSIRLCLMDEFTNISTLQIVSDNGSIPFFGNTKPGHCEDVECGRCIERPARAGSEHKTMQLSFPVQHQQQQFGVLNAIQAGDRKIEHWKVQIIRTIADNIATRISLNQQSDQEQRLSLMEERAVIARELHDSLAQALSYLKIQVTRLESLRSRKASEEKIDEVVHELGEGLSSAYRQLRELLTTFRLKLDKPSLNAAIIDTVEEFSSRGKIPINLVFDIGATQLRPNEEIHVLQVVREALSNIVRHAKAHNAEVALQLCASGVVVFVRDDGVGLPAKMAKRNHYGIIIMQERASGLSGELSISQRQSGGTEVKLTIPSQVLSASRVDSAS